MEASIHRPRVASPSETVRPLAIDGLNDAIQTIESFVREADWPLRLQNAWKHVKNAAYTTVVGARPVDNSEDIRTIKVQLEGLTKIVRGLADKPVTGKASYADILRSNTIDATVSADRTVPVPARRAREIIIAPGKEEPRQKQRSGLDIVRDINIELQDQSVVAARRLPSGDVMVTFEDQQKRDLWAKSPEIVRAFGDTARVKAREYTVIAHGIRVAAVDPAKKEDAIAGIIAQNPGLLGQVEIVRLAWARKTIKLGKRIAPLHIGVATPEQANTLIEQGLLLDSELHDCEVFWGDCQLVQCFHCQSYKHTAKHCRNAVRCGFCAAIGHASKDCANQGNPEMYRCAVCKGGKKHTSWARECPVRREQVAEAQKAYLTRPARFQVRTVQRAPSQASQPTAKDSENIVDTIIADNSPQPSIQTSTIQAITVRTGITATARVPVIQGSPDPFISDEEFQVIQPKRKRGRPSPYEVRPEHAVGSQDIRQALTQDTMDE
jgi:hypothetical protein